LAAIWPLTTQTAAGEDGDRDQRFRVRALADRADRQTPKYISASARNETPSQEATILAKTIWKKH
jgi:hypothetical protein